MFHHTTTKGLRLVSIVIGVLLLSSSFVHAVNNKAGSIAITRIVAVIDKAPYNTATTDSNSFKSVALRISFSPEFNTIILDRIDESDNFWLPTSPIDYFGNSVERALVTSDETIKGSYGLDGSIDFSPIPGIHLNSSSYQAELSVNLTTGKTPLPAHFSVDPLKNAGFSIDQNRQIVGSPVNSNGDVQFVGSGSVVNVTGFDLGGKHLADILRDSHLVLLVEGVIK